MSDKTAVLAKIDLLEFIGRDVKLTKAGKDYVGLCPFHGEKTGSMHVHPDTQKWKCFGCGAGGDAIDYYQRKKGLQFSDAVEELAKELGITTPLEKKGKAHTSLYTVLDQAARFYNWCLNQKDLGAKAREYLQARGLSLEKANELGIGFAARPFHKKLKDYQVPHAEQVGIIRRHEDGNLGDCLYERIIIPILDQDGRTIALTGRIAPWLGKDGPKYLNTCESPIFKKGETFFRLNPTAIREAGKAIVVEGQFDQLAMDLAGAPNTTGTCGTALTAAHIVRLKKITKKVLFLYDGDTAGQKAARRGIELAIEGGVNPYVAILPAGEDPDSLVRGGGLTAVEKVGEQDGFTWLLESVISQHADPVERAGAVIRELGPVVLKYTDPVLCDLRCTEVARALGVTEWSVRKKLGVTEATGREVSLEKALLYAAKVSVRVQQALKKRDRLDDLFEGANLELALQLLGIEKI